MAKGNGSTNGRDLRAVTPNWVSERAAVEASRRDGTEIFGRLRAVVRADVESARAVLVGAKAEFHEWGAADFVVVLHGLAPGPATNVGVRRFALSQPKTTKICVFDEEGRRLWEARTLPDGSDRLDVKGRQPLSPQQFSRLVFEDLFFA